MPPSLAGTLKSCLDDDCAVTRWLLALEADKRAPVDDGRVVGCTGPGGLPVLAWSFPFAAGDPTGELLDDLEDEMSIAEEDSVEFGADDAAAPTPPPPTTATAAVAAPASTPPAAKWEDGPSRPHLSAGGPSGGLVRLPARKGVSSKPPAAAPPKDPMAAALAALSGDGPGGGPDLAGLMEMASKMMGRSGGGTGGERGGGSALPDVDRMMRMTQQMMGGGSAPLDTSMGMSLQQQRGPPNPQQPRKLVDVLNECLPREGANRWLRAVSGDVRSIPSGAGADRGFSPVYAAGQIVGQQPKVGLFW